jgi:hypothetical protein
VHQLYSYEQFHRHQAELEHQARYQGLVRIAVRARRRNRKAARETAALRLASDTIAFGGGNLNESRSSLPAGR